VILARIGYSLEVIGAVPPAAIGSPVSYTFTARGGLSPYQLAVVSEDLPADWAWADDGNGVLTLHSDNPQDAGAYSFTIRVTDANRVPVDTTFSLTVIALPLSISFTSLPDGEKDIAYSGQATAQFGAPPYTYSKVTGPSWLSVNASTGLISGTPDATAWGVTVTVRVEDANSATSDVSDTINVTEVTDPYFASVSCLLKFNGANGGTIITDVKGHTFTANGDAITSTDQIKWGTAAGRVGAAGFNYFQSGTHADWQFGTGDFTIEWWQYWRSGLAACFATPFCLGYVGAGDIVMQSVADSGADANKCALYFSGGLVLTESSAAANDTWSFYQLVRSGSTVTLYRNGVSVGAGTSAANINSGQSLTIGSSPAGSGSHSARSFIDDFRITKGVARLNVVPTATFPES
jgi:hypothetical protein